MKLKVGKMLQISIFKPALNCSFWHESFETHSEYPGWSFLGVGNGRSLGRKLNDHFYVH